jgi:hypothetical protein
MRMRIAHGFKHLHLARLNHCDHLLALHGRKSVEKILNRLAAFEVVDEVLEWHARDRASVL